MRVDKQTQEDEVELEITVVQESKTASNLRWQILSNRIRGRLNSPTIIGYNRDHYGTRVMGAMVIVPEKNDLF